MSTAARRRTVETFDLSRQTRKLESLYEETVSHAAATSPEQTPGRRINEEIALANDSLL